MATIVGVSFGAFTVVLLAWPLLRWVAKRNRLPIVSVRKWWGITLATTLGAGLLAGFPSRPGRVSLIIAIPILLWLPLRYLAKNRGVSLKPLQRWLAPAASLLFVLSMTFSSDEKPSWWRNALLLAFASAQFISAWIYRRYTVETISDGALKAEFQIPSGTRVNVQDIGSLLPWCTGKLGMRVKEATGAELRRVALTFKEDGNPIVLEAPAPFRAASYPMLSTESLEPMRDILGKKGVEVGVIERDRMGNRTFAMRDPEGNVIDVVEES